MKKLLCLSAAILILLCALTACSDGVKLSAESLPEGFPDLSGSITAVNDGHSYGGFYDICWAKIEKEEIDALVAELNGWLDTDIDYLEQYGAYTDGSKLNSDGDEAIHVSLEYNPDANGSADSDGIIIYCLKIRLSGTW